jgi:molybdopterin-guanine dinucleotide biosynthesis protein A
MNLTAIILAGGKSSRMGKDKGLMLFEGQPMIQYILNTIKPLVRNVIIISNQKGYDVFNYPVYQDLIKNQGPLAGIATGLHHSTTDKNVVLSCDVPFITSKVMEELIDNCEGFDGVICGHKGRSHQLIGIYDKSCKELFNRELADGQRKVKLAIKKLNFKTINMNHIDDKVFYNINSKDDIKT